MGTALVPAPDAIEALPTQADDDAQMIRLWLARSASPHTRRNYEREVRQFMAYFGRPLGSVRMGELQDYIAARPGSSATVALTAAALKSLFAFAQEVGYLRFNIAAAVKVPPIKNTLAERIMSEADALLMIRQEPVLRNRVLLTVLYGGGLRISEVCGLRWRDRMARDEAGQATVFGKGGKTRAVLLSASTWKVLVALRVDQVAKSATWSTDVPVFLSRKGGALDPSAVHWVVKAAASRAGLPVGVSTRWIRHAHASHSLDRGAPIHLVQATLGHASVAMSGRYLHARPSESSARFLGV
ncbi:tyrosine-type recombinase/integrase [Methylobacterium sp. J-070]|uniref:tyrosine-type recombinase/integrase n=1 Tax=Methylobacterium sp. J-070 TaxID=2836650 RepID=UPI001FBBD534|nr:tyrosine-type recombinase/integrase [Methylobacterium sp. J-070]MCJ2049808.1 tyrosine-type recombinase/integrase [Methylobacterium sp. J-070]